MPMLGEVHCTAGAWIAAFLDPRTRRFTCRYEDVSEHTTEAEAREWLQNEARSRGQTMDHMPGVRLARLAIAKAEA